MNGGINKYGFNKLVPGQERKIKGKYNTILSCAINYGKRNEMKIIAINLGKVNEFSSDSKVLIKRVK